MAEEELENQMDMFEELKNIRIKKKLDLEKIAEKTKIHIKYLTAIESGNYKDIPEIYDKLFFQTYLSALKIRNKEKYLEEYRELRREIKPDYTTTIQKIRSMKSDPVRFTKTKQLYLIIPVIVVVIIIILLALNSKMLNTENKEPVKELSVREAASEIERKINPIPDSLKTPSIVNADTQSVKVGLLTQKLTWIRMVKDRTDTSEYLLRKGERLNLTADSTLVFLVGNAAGINFTVNGKNEGVLGQEYQVISYLKITKDGIVSKRLKEIIKENAAIDSNSVN